MPTSTHNHDEIESMYDQIEELIDEEKGNTHLIIMGDWNAVVGEKKEYKIAGNFGLVKRNERGERLIEFCKENKMIITNTLFEQNKRKRYTWKMPGDLARYQIDYIMVRERYKNSVKNSCTFPGADINSDHNLVVMSNKLILKKIKKGTKIKIWNLRKLKEQKSSAYRDNIENRFKACRNDLNTEFNVNDKWKEIKKELKKAAEAEIGYTREKNIKKPWITNEMLNKMVERRKWKNVNTETGKKTYKEINNELRRKTDQAKEIWLRNECEEIEELEKKGRFDLMYGRSKKLNSKKITKKLKATKEKKGKKITKLEKILERWKEYIEKLYASKG